MEYTDAQFVSSIGESVQVPKASLHPILFGGDQLTAARGRGAKKAKVHSDSPATRLDGLVPVAEDWHAKLTVLEVRMYLSNACGK